MYKLPVKIDRIEKRRRSAGILHMLAGLFVMLTGSSTGTHYNKTIEVLYVFLLIGLASIIYGAFRKKIDPSGKWNHWMRILQSVAFAAKGFMLFDSADTLTIVSLFIWSGVTLLLLFTEKKIYKPTVLGIQKDGIIVPGNFSDHLIPWDLVNNLLVRPDFVTITRENLSYVQLELLADMDNKDIDRINEFAREQLALHKNKEVNT